MKITVATMFNRNFSSALTDAVWEYELALPAVPRVGDHLDIRGLELDGGVKLDVTVLVDRVEWNSGDDPNAVWLSADIVEIDDFEGQAFDDRHGADFIAALAEFHVNAAAKVK